MDGESSGEARKSLGGPGAVPREIFENQMRIYAFSCILRDIKEPLDRQNSYWWKFLTVWTSTNLRSTLDDQMKRLDRVERHTCWEENGVCIELEGDLFLIEMAADRGLGVPFLTRALLSGTYYEAARGSKTYSRLFPFQNRVQIFFSPPSSFPFPVLMHRLLAPFIFASDDAKSA